MTSQWPDNCDTITWIVISNSLDIDFIHRDIHGRSYKNVVFQYFTQQPKRYALNYWLHYRHGFNSVINLCINVKSRKTCSITSTHPQKKPLCCISYGEIKRRLSIKHQITFSQLYFEWITELLFSIIVKDKTNHIRFLQSTAGYVALATPVMRDIVGLKGLDIFLGIRTTLVGLGCVALTLGSGMYTVTDMKLSNYIDNMQSHMCRFFVCLLRYQSWWIWWRLLYQRKPQAKRVMRNCVLYDYSCFDKWYNHDERQSV